MKNERSIFEPKVVAFLCRWCSYAAADHAGMLRRHYSPGVYIIEVMCSGRVEASQIFEAYQNGADGVIIGSCRFGDCHYQNGNIIAFQRYRLLIRVLQQLGITKERCLYISLASTEGSHFAERVTEFVSILKKLGPLSLESKSQQEGLQWQ